MLDEQRTGWSLASCRLGVGIDGCFRQGCLRLGESGGIAVCFG